MSFAPPVTSGATAAERRTGGGGSADLAQQFSSSLATVNRIRGDNPIAGFATPRQPLVLGGGGGDFVSNPFWGPWGSWYPWYSSWGFGYYGYNPWYYGATCWSWGRWGAWYDPYGYCWNSWNSYYWGAPTTYVEIAGTHHNTAKLEPKTGEIRILASPKTAKVYIDDALVGTVDEFDGLNDHLEIATGPHVIGLRADGYEQITKDIVVEGGKTHTVRLTMKKIK